MPDVETVPLTSIRALEDRVLQLETMLAGLDDKQSDLRSEVRMEITSLRNEIKALAKAMETSNSQINGKLDRLFGARSVVTALITLMTSIAGTGLVHLVVSIGK
ncbi:MULTISPECIES: hypothetical protein [unclassified Gluconobacter]|uniref:hypothetical protein n=1 Tax=unclassified Gluconobacter TaxID=2644261 RepID=UPI001C04AFDD|nr:MULTISPECIES: hypothetical protein [unclassified Gluconobacter]